MIVRYTWTLALSVLCRATLTAAALAPASPPREWPTLGAAVRANMKTLHFDGGVLSGAGADFLVDEGRRSRFFVIGEQHMSREIPQFTAALFRALHDEAGYSHLALEQDPLMAIAVSAPDTRGRETAVFDYVRRYPNAFTFDTVEEIRMISDVGAISDAAMPIWGLDQMFGALHVLERLRPHARDAAAGERIDALIRAVRPYEASRFARGRRFMLGDVGIPDDLWRIEELVAPTHADARFLASQLRRSLQIYSDYRAAKEGQPTKYRQTYEREENMKRLFMHFRRRGREVGERSPRVLVKAGHQHSIRGENWSGVLSLGNFLSALAKSEGSRSFHLAVYMNNDEPGYYDILSKDSDYGPLFRAIPTDQSVIIDLRPLRPLVYSGRLPEVTAELRRVIFGFDAALLIGNGHRGTDFRG